MKCNMNLHNGIESHKQTTNWSIEFPIRLKKYNHNNASTRGWMPQIRMENHLKKPAYWKNDRLRFRKFCYKSIDSTLLRLTQLSFLFPSLPFCTLCFSEQPFDQSMLIFMCVCVFSGCIVLHNWTCINREKETLEKASTLFALLIEKFIRSITSLSFHLKSEEKKKHATKGTFMRMGFGLVWFYLI